MQLQSRDDINIEPWPNRRVRKSARVVDYYMRRDGERQARYGWVSKLLLKSSRQLLTGRKSFSRRSSTQFWTFTL